MGIVFRISILLVLLGPAILGAEDPQREILEISADLEFHRALGSSTTVDFDFSPAGDTAASITAEGITIWNMETWEVLQTIPLPSKAIRVCYSPDGKLLASADPFTILLWSTEDWSPTRKLTSSSGSFNDITFAPDGKRLHAAGHSSSVQSWDTETWTRKKTALRNVLKAIKGVKGSGRVSFVAISPDGKLAATGGLTKNILIWKQGKKRRWKGVLAMKESPPRFASEARFSKDGRSLGIAGSGRLRLFDVAKGKITHDLELDPPERRTGPLPVGIEFSADGTKVYTIGHQFQVWDVKTGKRLERSKLGSYMDKEGGPSFVYGAQLLRSPDSRWMAVRFHDHPVRIYKLEKMTDRD